MRTIILPLTLAFVLAAAPGCGGDENKTTGSSCSADGDCSGGVCFDSQCHTTCTAQAECGEDELCVQATSASGEAATFCNVAASYSGCESAEDCDALVAGPCDVIACDASVGLCGFTHAEDGTPCKAEGQMWRCESGLCVVEQPDQDVLEPRDVTEPEDASVSQDVSTWTDTALPPQDVSTQADTALPPQDVSTQVDGTTHQDAGEPEDATPPEDASTWVDASPPQDAGTPEDCVAGADLPGTVAWKMGGEQTLTQVTVIFDPEAHAVEVFDVMTDPETITIDKRMWEEELKYAVTNGGAWDPVEVSAGELMIEEGWFEWMGFPLDTDLWISLKQDAGNTVTITFTVSAEEGVTLIDVCWEDAEPFSA
jgi:hypothetical protein